MLYSIQPINDRKIRIAIVGCGRISRNHIKAIAIHRERAELVAICDTQQQLLDQTQKFVAEVAAENLGDESESIPAQFQNYTDLLAAATSKKLPST